MSAASMPKDGAPFVTEFKVRFADCDLAGIVFYPRYIEMFNAVVEDWCADGLGVPFRELHMEHGLGFPTVRLETDFKAPSTVGDMLRAELAVEKIGGASFTIAIRLFGPGNEERVRGRLVLAAMDLTTRRAIQIPAPLRGRIASFLPPPST
jgi:4-hydroxybenzoyl-CoA thioesterase